MKKSKITRVLLTLCTAVMISVLGSGCWFALLAGAGAGIAGTAYVNGKLTTSLEATPQQIKPAAEAAFKELKIKLISSTANSLDAKITGKTVEGTDVTVSASLKKDGKSELGIRVGAFGDQEMSEKIYMAMDKELKKGKK